MRKREPAGTIPPARHPYIRVSPVVLGERVEYVLRVPSLHQVATLQEIVDEQQRRAFFALAAIWGGGAPIGVVAEALRTGGRGMVELAGALIGVSWRDPLVGLQTPQPLAWDPERARAYGAAVFEELHEEGWTLSAVTMCVLALVAEIGKAATLEEEVREQAAFFLGPKATPPDGSPKPSPSSSEDGSDASRGAS